MTFIIGTTSYKTRKNVAEDNREIEEILPPILRKHGAVDAKDGDSVDVLDSVHFMGLVWWCIIYITFSA